jgi:hypothetical protein
MSLTTCVCGKEYERHEILCAEPSDTPRTEAGRALLDASDVLLMMSDDEIIGLNEGELELQIVAIEREASDTSPPTEGLDVERLVEALDASWGELLAPLGGQSDGLRRSAEKVAAEYARLRSTQDET